MGDKGGRGFGSEKCKGVKEGKVLAVFKTGKQIKEVKSYLIDKTVVKVKEGTRLLQGCMRRIASCGKEVSVWRVRGSFLGNLARESKMCWLS